MFRSHMLIYWNLVSPDYCSIQCQWRKASRNATSPFLRFILPLPLDRRASLAEVEVKSLLRISIRSHWHVYSARKIKCRQSGVSRECNLALDSIIT